MQILGREEVLAVAKAMAKRGEDVRIARIVPNNRKERRKLEAIHRRQERKTKHSAD